MACRPAGRLEVEERTGQARIGSGRREFGISPYMFAVHAGIGDELNGSLTQFSDGGDNFICQPAFPAIHYECALIPRLNDDISTVAHQHVNVSADRQHMDFAVVRFRIRRTARFRGLVGHGLQFGQRFRFSCILGLRREAGIHRLCASQAGDERQLILL
jgi:hypothetical protein